jgi:hypothetical protein
VVFVVAVHVPVAVYGAAIEFVGWICPLTPLENSLRHQAGESGYSAGFIEHYLLPVLYPSALTRDIQLFLGVAVIGINLGIYVYVLRRRHKARRSRKDVPLGNPSRSLP